MISWVESRNRVKPELPLQEKVAPVVVPTQETTRGDRN